MVRPKLRNLPSSVVRELLRHVQVVAPSSLRASPNPAGHNNTSAEAAAAAALRMNRVLAGCVAVIATATAFPVMATYWIGNLNLREEALTAPQVRRGAFQNSGSRDVGRDPNWVLLPNGQWGSTERVVLPQQQATRDVGIMPSGTYSARDEAKFQAVATGDAKRS